jgi:hypothetical protein
VEEEMSIDWLSLILGSAIGAGTTWILTRAEVAPLRRELKNINQSSEKTSVDIGLIRSGVVRIEEGQKVSAIGEDSIRDTVNLAVTTLLAAIVIELGPDITSSQALDELERLFPRQSAQWSKVTPERDTRLKVAAAAVSHWQAVNKARGTWDPNWRANGGVQIGPDLWIPANRVVHIENGDPLPFGARIAAKPWFGNFRATIFGATVLGGLTLLLTWGAIPGTIALLALFGWLVLLLSNLSLFEASKELKDELSNRPDWSVLFPPGAILDGPCQVLFGWGSRTRIFQYPLSMWTDPAVVKAA